MTARLSLGVRAVFGSFVMVPACLGAQETIGPAVVSHPAEDVALDWRFEAEWTVGGVTDTLLGRAGAILPGQVDVDSQNRVYVLQRSDARVVVLTGDGELLTTIGSKGGGPGRLSAPVGLSVTGDSLLSVYDRTNGVVRWRLPTGEPTTGIRAHVLIWGASFWSDSSGFAFTESETLRGGRTGRRRRLHVSRWTPASGVERLVSGPGSDQRVTEFPSCGLAGLAFPRIFEPQVSWAARNRRLAVVGDIAYDIRVFEDYRPVLRIRRDIAPRPVTEEMAAAEAEARGEVRINRSCVVSGEEAVRQIGTADYLSAVTAVRVSPKGHVWALRGRTGAEPAMIDLFGSAGDYMGTLPAGSPLPAVVAFDDRVLVVDADEYDVATLTMYRIVRGSAG